MRSVVQGGLPQAASPGRAEAAFLPGALESQGMAEIRIYYVLGQYL